MYASRSLILTLFGLFLLAGCGPRATPITVDPGDSTPPILEIVAANSTYSDDGSRAPEPIDVSRTIRVPGDPAGIAARATDFESAIDFVTLRYDLRSTCWALVPNGGTTSWASTGTWSYTFDPRNVDNPIPFLANSRPLTRETIFSVVCNTDRPGTVPEGTTGFFNSNPRGRYTACACNRSAGPGSCSARRDKCTVVSGEIIFTGMQGPVPR